MPKVESTFSTPAAQPETAQKPKGFKGFKNPFATSGKTAPEPKQARPMGSNVFAEAGQSTRSSGIGKAFSRGLRFMTAAHPDTVRNRAENIGTTFAARVDKFENGKGGGFMGPLFGMGFKNYDRPAAAPNARPATGQSPGFRETPAGFAPGFGQGSGHAQPAATPAYDPQQRTGYAAFNPDTFSQHVQDMGADFAARVDAFAHQGAGPEGPLGGMGFGRPAAAPVGGAPSYTPPPNPGGFMRQATATGPDFAARVNQFSADPAARSNPFAGTGQTESPAQAEASAGPKVSDQQRIDSAKADFRATQTRLTAELREAKLTASETASIAISTADARIEKIGRDLEATFGELDRSNARSTQYLKDRIAALKLHQKDVRKEMIPLQQAAFAAGTDSRASTSLDSDTAAKKARYAALMQMQTDLRHEIESAEEVVSALAEDHARLRLNLMDQAENEMAGLQDEIRQTRSGLDSSLRQLDENHTVTTAQEKARIAQTYGVKFR